ncbi:FkbM family methyltransferase [Tabrizicola sp. TH137]|uniref:FkbM family methyltransferase n=1 Tax=Tabrizicola sp. TH137 TaxID=2067452 RepID=UPI001304466B|nr:FkbM family methyltransferase [Tabrizicola sp. TH137]
MAKTAAKTAAKGAAPAAKAGKAKPAAKDVATAPVTAASKLPVKPAGKAAKAPSAQVMAAVAEVAASLPAIEIVARTHGIEVPASPHLGPNMRKAIEEGRYEAREIRAGLARIPKGARILELGAGAGIVGAVLARNLAPAALLSVEANPTLIESIRALHAHNGLDGVISVRNCVVLSAPDAPESVEFFLRGNFLGSSLTPLKIEKAKPVTVPVLRYADLAAEFPHDAIMMDIEGGELEFLRHADLSAVKVVVGEFHREIYGRPGMQECRRLLRAQGFEMDEEESRNGVWAWVRP